MRTSGVYGVLAALLGCHPTATAVAQKPPIDVRAVGTWPELGSAQLTNDGRFACYTIANQPLGGRTLVLQATDARWRRAFPGVGSCRFTDDSRRALVPTGRDSLAVVPLGRGGGAITYLAGVRSFELRGRGPREVLGYQRPTPAPAVVVRTLATGQERVFAGVSDYWLSMDGRGVLLQTAAPPEGRVGARAVPRVVRWLSLVNGRVTDQATTVWEGAPVDNVVFDPSGTQVAFRVAGSVADSGASHGTTSVWYYRAGMARAVLLAHNQAAGLDAGLRVAGIQRFSNDGARLFVTLMEPAPPRPTPGAVPVNVWSYTDPKLQAQQLAELKLGPKRYTAVLGLEDRRILRLQRGDEWLSLSGPAEEGTDELGLVSENNGGDERSWYGRPYVVSTRTGLRQWELPAAGRQFRLSPGGKYVVYYDAARQSWFSQDLASGVARDITPGLATTWMRLGADKAKAAEFPRGVAGWVQGDAAVFLYDRYDLWQADLTGRQRPLNLTNGYGRRHNIVFYLGLEASGRRPLAPTERPLLLAFDWATKDNGFYRTALGQAAEPERLSMGRYVYWLPDFYVGRAPLKARDAERYLVRRMSATEAPNYFATTDFKTFTRLSDLRPEQAYNWLTTELVTWQTPAGRTAQGVLYKPADFDSTKRYPVIFRYYDKMSHQLNVYLKPDTLAGGCNLDIPSFVSSGYLVFSPDIHFTVGAPGPSTVQTLVSAADHLARRPWVDEAKMGVQSCSWGGFLTNYLVAHTDRFVAAVSAAGNSDWISSYGSLTHGGTSAHQAIAQDRLGATLWERPDLYIENSPVLQADKVTTPLLLMHTTADDAVPFAQAVEFFMALRRLGKRAWLLEYEDGNHGIHGKSAEDFRLRLTQFFDHYLKGAPPPKWMTEGVPARLKGLETGLELDRSGRVPGPGLVQAEEPGPPKTAVTDGR